MGVAPVRTGDDRHQPSLHRFGGLAGAKAGAIRHPEDMGVDRAGLFTEEHIEHHIGGLSADARQRLKRGARLRHLATMLAHQNIRQRQQILCLGIEKTDGPDVVHKALKPQREHLFRRLHAFKKLLRCPVHADIGRLRREHHRHQQLIAIAIGKLGFRHRVVSRQQREGLLDLSLCPAFGEPCFHFFQTTLRPLSPSTLLRLSHNLRLMSATSVHLVLTPHRSLSPKGFRLLMLISFGLAMLLSLRFLAFSGKAWPVAAFLMLDVLLLYVAFRLNYASAREREELRLTGDRLEVTQRSRSGATISRVFNPYWVRIVLEAPNDFENRLSLVVRGETFPIGSFLSPHERITLRDELQRQLAAFRSPSMSRIA
jgi:uncharacterized membrane protein